MKLSQIIKRTILAFIAVAVALTWSQTGRAQTFPCIVGRGQDPLDVVNSGVRHNLWIILDSSGSMNDPFPGSTDSKIDVARQVIKTLMANLVDAAGRPLVNWAFVHYDNFRDFSGKCGGPDAADDLDVYPDKPDGCVGLKDSSFVPPPLCGDDSREDIGTILDGISASGITPIGVTFTDIAEYLTGNHRPDDPAVPANTTNFVTNLLPDQRNYVIQVTDGRDTCECEDGGYPSFASTDPADLVTPVDMRPSQADPTVTQSSTAAADIASFNAGLKGEVAIQEIDPALDGSQGNVFVIGMDLSADDKRRINTIAWMASGARLTGRAPEEMTPAFFADEQDELVDAFENILARIGVPSTEVSLGASIVGSVKEVIASRTNPAVDPLDVIPPTGADAQAFRQARTIRANHRNNVVFSTTVEVPSFRGHLKAHSIYKVTDPDFPRTAREADLTLLWDAGEELQDDDPDERPFYFNKRGSKTILPFDTANVLPEDLGVDVGYLSELDGIGAHTANHARDIVVKVMRGYRISVDPITGTIYDGNGDLNFSLFEETGEATWKLGESTAGSVAVVLNPPRSPDFDPPQAHAADYGVGGSVPGDGFYWDHINRRTLVVYPSNQGILHFFDAETGEEVAGYLPDDVVGLDPNELPGSRDTLKDIVKLIATENNGIVNHKFTLSGSPTVDDVFLRQDQGADNKWHTVIVFARGRGGRFVTAIDATGVATDPSSLQLLWNRGNREGINEGPIDGLGETWSTPVLGNVDKRDPAVPSDDNRVDQALVFVGAGYGCESGAADANEGQYLFAFKAENGDIYYRGWVGEDTSAEIAYNAVPARPTLFNPHEQDLADNKDFVTRVYIPDVQGKIHKLDTTDPDPAMWTLRVFAEMGTDHPITAPVTLLNDVFAPDRVFVMAGSGGDRRVDAPDLGFKFRIWVDNDVDGTNNAQYTSTDTPLWEQFFNDEERMFSEAVTLGTIGDPVPPVALYVASEESFDALTCVVSFTSTLYGVIIESGQPFYDLDPSSPSEATVALGEGKANLTASDGTAILKNLGEVGTNPRLDFWGDGEFDAESMPAGAGQFTLQLAVEGFRISPF